MTVCPPRTYVRARVRVVARFVVRALAFVLALTTLAAAPLAAQQVDVIRGRVAGPDREAVEGANVTVTSVSGNVNRTARSDRNGRFTVTFPGGDGDYMVSFTAIGYAPKRFEVKRIADEDFLVADATLQRTSAQLDTVKVTAGRDRVRRGDASQDVSGTERRVDNAAVPPEQMGDLAAMAASIPGVTPVPGADGDPAGFSVLGLSADQNQTTMNGMNTAGGNLPRDAGVMSSLVTSPWDVSTGGFSGARFNVVTRPGTNYITRTGSLFGTAPQVQWTDRAGRALGQQQTNLSLGGSASGPIVFDRMFYNVAYQLGRSANDLYTLLDANPAGLQATGLAADSVRRLAGILGQQQVPTSFRGLPSSRLSDQGSLFGAFDFTPASSNAQSFNLTANGGWNRQTPLSSMTTEFPAHSGDRTGWNAGLQARHSSYVRNVVLSETQLGASGSHSWTTPYVSLPSGSVLVNSTLDDGTSSLRSIGFGGSPFLNTAQTTTYLGATNQLSWFSTNNKHRLKLASELRRDGYAQDATNNLLGSFAYNSLADVAAGQPALFTRQLSPRARSGSQYVAALSLGDSYKRTPRLQLQYGVRLDANRFAAGPSTNPAVAQAFGVPNDAVPDHLYVSPRVGFSWAYGTAAQVAGFDGAVRGPRAVLRGGIGVFQNTAPTTLLGGAIDNTGLPGALQQVVCAGPAVPIPDWAAYVDPAAIPSHCAAGSPDSPFASAVPNVSLFSRDWQAPRSLRSNLNWSGPVLGNRFTLSADGTFARNVNQPSFVDLNFAGAEQFRLSGEGGRPVYVQPSSIAPASGAIAARDARVSPLFARVSEQRSDLRSETRQLQLGLGPATFSTRWRWSLNYTLADSREQSRGFTSTAGNPLAVDWSRSPFQPRHSVNYTLYYNAADVVRITWSGIVRSGLPFTPLIAGDVNGDGYANDRAYIARPSNAGDSVLAAGMQALLTGGSGEARDCLTSQLGRIAARGSCTGPWSHAANLSVSFNPLKLRLPQRATLSFGVSNPLGAADQLLHGDRGLRGWGQTSLPDATLLQVVGFDASQQRFRYAVNQRFGATRPSQSTVRQPVMVTARLNFDVGPTRERQGLTQLLDRGRRHGGDRAPEVLLRAMYGTGGGIVNPIEQVLRQADTLQLTGPQADSVATMNRWYKLRVDSIWTPVTKRLAALPDDYDQADAYDQYVHARRATIDILMRLAPQLTELLTPAQRRKLPPFIATYLDTRYLASIRSGTAGGNGAGGPMIMGGMGGPPMGGASGNIIIR